MSGSEWLGPIVSDSNKLKSQAILRKKNYQELSINKTLINDYLQSGWTLEKESVRKYKIKKQWEHNAKLENQVWYLLYLLGYPEISEGRNFQVTIKQKGIESYKKNISVMAKDDETVIITECKSSETIIRKSLQKDIDDFSNLKSPIANAINKHYGPDKKLKILWMFFTSNIAWSEQDKQKALDANIHVVTEKELKYYRQIAEHLKSAARFQFLAEFLKNQKIPEMENIKVPAVKGKLGGKTYYSFVSTPKQMLKISFVNHRSLNDPSGAPAYQRLVSKNRLNDVSKFIATGGFFPTNILVNFDKKCQFESIAKDENTNVTFGNLILPCRYRSAWIIDGQHRLYGYAPLEDKYLDQNIMVVAFEELKKEEEANLFVTINHEQKSVPKTLLDDLEGELKWGSDKSNERIGAISARLISQLNTDIGAPLYGCVTQQGITPTDKTCLTVPALKDGLVRSGLLGTTIPKNKAYSPGPLCGLNDLETLNRARIIINSYLQLLSNANTLLWESGRKGIICSNVSIQGLFLLLSELILFMESKTGQNARKLSTNDLINELNVYIDPILKFLNISDIAQIAIKFKVQYGAGGPKEFFYRLCSIIKETFNDFNPNGMVEWQEAQSEELINEANRKIKDLNILVQKTIFDVFKTEYGTDINGYWDKGITDKEIKTRAYNKSLDVPSEERLPLENYLDFIEYKKIVENKAHWPLFKPYFDIPEIGEKGNAKNVKWMDRINELRRISAHPTEHKQYKSEDFKYIDYIYNSFMIKIGSRA